MRLKHWMMIVSIGLDAPLISIKKKHQMEQKTNKQQLDVWYLIIVFLCFSFSVGSYHQLMNLFQLLTVWIVICRNEQMNSTRLGKYCKNSNYLSLARIHSKMCWTKTKIWLIHKAWILNQCVFVVVVVTFLVFCFGVCLLMISIWSMKRLAKRQWKIDTHRR